MRPNLHGSDGLLLLCVLIACHVEAVASAPVQVALEGDDSFRFGGSLGADEPGGGGAGACLAHGDDGRPGASRGRASIPKLVLSEQVRDGPTGPHARSAHEVAPSVHRWRHEWIYVPSSESSVLLGLWTLFSFPWKLLIRAFDSLARTLLWFLERMPASVLFSAIWCCEMVRATPACAMHAHAARWRGSLPDPPQRRPCLRHRRSPASATTSPP